MTALMMSWILAICTGHKIASYLSDISGAFDRVFRDYMCAKLYAAGVGSKFLNFLLSYLKPRRAVVVAEGVKSDEFEISNQVFQGTVLGPPLWNTFFSDVTIAASTTGGKPSMFADDLNVFQKFDRRVSNEECLKTSYLCRERVHKWGRANRVAFDATKEHAVIIHPLSAEGDPFKLLGLLVDCKLIMLPAVEKILSQIKPKIRAILRTKKYYDNKTLISQFKTHIWGVMECHSGGLFHASDSVLKKLDQVHFQFLHELEMNASEAFADFNFAPPMLRRNIGVLGLLHKRVLGLGHPIFQKLLPFCAELFNETRPGRHNKQLYGHLHEVNFQMVLYCHSIFAMTQVYNQLSQDVVNCKTVSHFQHCLTSIARKACKDGNPEWMHSFSCRM